MTSERLDARIKQKELVNKSDNSDLKTKLCTIKTQAELKAEQDKIIKLGAFDSSYFHGKNFCGDDGFKICLFINQHLIC